MSDPLDPVRAVMAAPEDIDQGDVPLAGEGAAPDDAPPREDDGRDGLEPDGPDAAEVPPEAVAANFPLNDIGNGRRFCAYFGEDTLFVPRVGWFLWKGTVWAKDPDSLDVRRHAQKVSELIEGEVAHLKLSHEKAQLLEQEPDLIARLAVINDIAVGDRDQKQKIERVVLMQKLDAIAEIRDTFRKRADRHFGHAKSTGNSAKIDAMLKEASVAKARPLADLDADPLAVNTASGVLLFSVERPKGAPATVRVELVPPQRDLLLTKCMPVERDPAAKAPQWIAFIERIQPNPKMRAFLQRWFGLSMTGITGEQKLLFAYGNGANGKSVLVDLMAKMMGDYAATAKIESLTGQSKRGGADATPDLIPLMGARFVRASEPEQGERLKEGTIKELTGGEPILVRALHSDFVEVQPQFKLMISGNYKPEIRGTDDGIWRRVLLTPFDVQIPEGERDPDLGAKLWEERAGILEWMIAGLLDYLKAGLQVPEEVLSATSEYRADSDPIGSFLTDCTVMDGGEHFMLSRDLIAAFNFWLSEKGENVWGGRTVSNALKSHSGRWHHPATQKTFVPSKQSATGYRGVMLTDLFARRMAEAAGGGRGDMGGSGDYGRDSAPPDHNPDDWVPDY